MRPSSPWGIRIKPSADAEVRRLPSGPKSAFRKLLHEIADDPLDVAGMRAFRGFRDAYIVNFYVSYRRARRVEIIAAAHREVVYRGMPEP